MGIVVGQKFARLTVVETGLSTETKKKRALTRVACECGSVLTVRNCHLTSGHSKSCGCLQQDAVSSIARVAHLKHGHGGVALKKAPIYYAWEKIKDCVRSGWERDIHLVCHEMTPRWESFENFLEDMGEISSTQTIVRVNQKLPWAKENCVVASGRRTGPAPLMVGRAVRYMSPKVAASDKSRSACSP